MNEFIRAFEECTLPRAEWTHRAHLAVAAWYLSRHDYPEGLSRIREGILRYNAACGTVTTATSGYHETLTQFYARLVCHLVRDRHPIEDWPALIAELEQSAGTDAPLRHYSRERLMSVEARSGWVEPDLVPMPEGEPVRS